VQHGILSFLKLDEGGRQHLDDGVRILMAAAKEFQIYNREIIEITSKIKLIKYVQYLTESAKDDLFLR
jgi:hypothetical protein